LNRTEYANAIQDLLAFDARAIASTLPPDAAVGGFDNIASALSVSPTLLEGYALAAMQIGRQAVGDRTMGHGETRSVGLGDLSRDEAEADHCEDQPEDPEPLCHGGFSFRSWLPCESFHNDFVHRR